MKKISSCPVPDPRIPSISHRYTMLRHALLVCKFELQWILLWWTHGIFCKPLISDNTINEWFIWHSTRSKNTKEYCLFSIQFKVDRLQIIVVAKKYIYVSQLFISRMPKMRAIPQLVSAPLNPIPIAEHFRRSHPPCEHSRGQHI